MTGPSVDPGTLHSVVAVLRCHIGVLRIMFSQLGHKSLNPKREDIHKEIVERWSFSQAEAAAVDVILAHAKPIGGRDVVEFQALSKYLRQPKGHSKPAPDADPRGLSVSSGVARDVARELEAHLSAAAKLNSNPGSLNLLQFTKSIRLFDDRIDAYTARDVFLEAAGIAHAAGETSTERYATIKDLVKKTLPHLPLARHKAFSSAQVKDAMSWAGMAPQQVYAMSSAAGGSVIDSRRTGGSSAIPHPPPAAAMDPGFLPPRPPATRSTRSADLRKTTQDRMLSERIENQKSLEKFSIYSPRRMEAEGRSHPRSARRPHLAAAPAS